MKHLPSVSVIIPAFNEEKRIKETLKNILNFCTKNIPVFEIIVVNDGSTDNTDGVVNSFSDKHVRLITYAPNVGKGNAVRVGALSAQHDLVLFTDADNATPIEQLLAFVECAKTYDVVIGSRTLVGSTIITYQPWYRQLLGKMFPLLVKMLVLSDFNDTQCGFKLFKRYAAQEIFRRQTLFRWAFDVETLVIARKKGFRIKELPVQWIDKKGSKILPVRTSIEMFKDLLKLKWNDYKGLYD